VITLRLRERAVVENSKYRDERALGILASCALVAVIVPARRAARIHPGTSAPQRIGASCGRPKRRRSQNSRTPMPGFWLLRSSAGPRLRTWISRASPAVSAVARSMLFRPAGDQTVQ
jgi:hypothetical protein